MVNDKIGKLRQILFRSKLTNKTKFTGNMKQNEFCEILERIGFTFIGDIEIALAGDVWNLYWNGNLALSGNDFEIIDSLFINIHQHELVKLNTDYIVLMAKHLDGTDKFENYVERLGQYWLSQNSVLTHEVLSGFIEEMTKYYEQQNIAPASNGESQPQ